MWILCHGSVHDGVVWGIDGCYAGVGAVGAVPGVELLHWWLLGLGCRMVALGGSVSGCPQWVWRSLSPNFSKVVDCKLSSLVNGHLCSFLYMF